MSREYSAEVCPICQGRDLADLGKLERIVGDVATVIGHVDGCEKCLTHCEIKRDGDFTWHDAKGKQIFEDDERAEGTLSE